MKRILVLAAAMVFVFVMAAMAGEYHTGESLSCYQCHVMHYSQSHGYGYTHDVDFLGTDGPYNYLLRDHVNNLCLQCHDEANGGHNLDVYQADGTYPAGNRQAGFLNRVGDVNTEDGHTLDYTGTVPGAHDGEWQPDAVEGLKCTDCHQQHGYFGDDPAAPDPIKGQYRNLIVNPGNVPYGEYRYVTYDKFDDAVYPNPAFDVNWRSTNIHDELTANQVDYIDFYEPDQTASHYGAWCQSCHTDFHGNSGDAWMHNADGWLRHPTAEANIGGMTGGGYSSLEDFATHLYRPQVMSSTGDWGTQGSEWLSPPTDLTPSCFTCHKAHGNGNAFGLIYMTGTAPRSENGDGADAKEICKICHVQGG